MIYYVRHGQTDFNLYKITQGQIDTSLNRTGLAQAKQLAEELKHYKFDTIFCSPLIRTRQTLEEILKYHPEVVPIFDDRLKEIGKGVLEGGRNSLDVYADFYAHPEKYSGETSRDVFNRINSFVTDLQQQDYGNTLIVAHHGIYKYFPFCMENKDIERDELLPYKIANCEIVNLTEIVEQDNAVLSEPNEESSTEELSGEELGGEETASEEQFLETQDAESSSPVNEIISKLQSMREEKVNLEPPASDLEK